MHIRTSNRFLPILLILAILVITAALSIPQTVNAQSDNKVVITMFWGDGCPHCAVERPFLKSLQSKYPNLEVRTYEVWYVNSNIPIMEKVAKAGGFEVTGVPITLLGDKNWVGYSDGVGKEIEDAVKACTIEACKDPAKDALSPDELAAGVPLGLQAEGEGTRSRGNADTSNPSEATSAYTLSIPLLGSVDLQKQSLAIATALDRVR